MANASLTSKASLLWVIKDFLKCPITQGVTLESPPFSAKENLNKLWRIRLWSKPHSGSACSSERLVPIIMLQKTNTDVDIKSTIQFSVVDAEFRQKCVDIQRHTFSGENEPYHMNEIPRDMLLDKKCTLFNNGNLIVHCQISFADESEPAPEAHCENNGNLRRILFSYPGERMFSDIVIKAQDKEFMCHKAILSCRSEYFSDLCAQANRDTHVRNILVTRMSPDVFEKLLRYIYTGEADISENDVFYLLLAAEKFHLHRLKAMCEEKLHFLLSFENATKLFTFASIYNIRRLKMNTFRAITFFPNKVTGFNSLSSRSNFVDEDSIGLSIKRLIHVDEPFLVSLASKTKTAAAKSKETGKVAKENIKLSSENDGTFLNQISWDVKKVNQRTFLPKADYWCRTDCVLTMGKWTIPDFTSCLCPGYGDSVLHSVTSQTGEWQICVQEEYLSGYLDISLDLRSAKRDSSYSIEYKFSVLCKDGKEANVLSGSYNIDGGQLIPFVPSVSDLSKRGLLHGRDLVLCYSLIARESFLYDCASPTVPKCDLDRNMSFLLHDKRFADVIIKVKGERFPCHKIILSSSPFFATRFQENSCKSEEEIVDIQPNTFRKVLWYIYTGICQLTVSEMLELVPLADKYFLWDMLATYEDDRIPALTVENACKFLLFSDSVKATKLKERSLQFIVQNLEEVLETSEWAHVARHAHLLAACFKDYNSV